MAGRTHSKCPVCGKGHKYHCKGGRRSRPGSRTRVTSRVTYRTSLEDTKALMRKDRTFDELNAEKVFETGVPGPAYIFLTGYFQERDWSRIKGLTGVHHSEIRKGPLAGWIQWGKAIYLDDPNYDEIDRSFREYFRLSGYAHAHDSARYVEGLAYMGKYRGIKSWTVLTGT